MALEFEAASKTRGQEETQEGFMSKEKKVEEKKERKRSQRK